MINKSIKQNLGITLIALVVSVIVLIILAGVSTNLVLGDKGIITVAKRAKENIELSSIEEKNKLNALYSKLETENTEQKNTLIEIQSATSPENCTYNGKEQKWTPTIMDTNAKKLTENKDYTVEYNTTNFIDAGDITVTVKGCGNYTGTIIKNYTIERATLTIKTKGASKVYDGQNLTNASMTVEGLVNGETLTARTTGSQREVGSSQNTYTISWTESTAKQENYRFTEELGTLIVTEY